MIHVDDYGTDAAAFVAAIDATGFLGGEVRLRTKTYDVTPLPGGAVTSVFADKPIQLVGEGALYSAIKPYNSLYGIVLKPNPGINCTHTRLADFHIGDPYTGLREGGPAILALTTGAGEQLAGLTLSGLTVGEAGSLAFYHANGPAANINGGFYCGVIEKCAFKGGIRLENSGDSIAIRDVTLSGSGNLWVMLVDGATGPFVSNANITSQYGAIRHVRGHRFKYNDLNIEHTIGNGERGCVVDIGGPYYPIQGGEIRNALVSKFDQSQAYGLIRLENCIGTVIDGVTLLSEHPGCMGIDIMPSCRGVQIGSVVYNGNVTPIRDWGQGTVIRSAPVLL